VSEFSKFIIIVHLHSNKGVQNSLEAVNMYPILDAIEQYFEKILGASCQEPEQTKLLEWLQTHGLSAKAKPILGDLSRAFVSNSEERVIKDLGFHSCWRTAPSFPWLLSRVFMVVRGSRA